MFFLNTLAFSMIQHCYPFNVALAFLSTCHSDLSQLSELGMNSVTAVFCIEQRLAQSLFSNIYQKGPVHL